MSTETQQPLLESQIQIWINNNPQKMFVEMISELNLNNDANIAWQYWQKLKQLRVN
jgi:hypothetical protein